VNGRRALAVCAAVGFVVLAQLPARAQAVAPHRYAVVIGANKASPGRRDLRYAHNDAQEVADTLIRVAGYAYDNVTILLDPDPQQVLTALDAYLAREPSGAEALLLFYYSGHADAEALYPNGRPLLLSALKRRLDDERMNVRVGLIDACRGGGWTGAKGLTAAPPFPVEWPVALDNHGSVLIASSSGWEDAHESEALRGSFFTHHWNAGLRGAADLNGDGTITASEAFDYAQMFTVRDTAVVAATPQHPSFRIDLSGRRDLALVSLTNAKTTLSLKQTSGPLQLVHLDTGLLILESPRGPRDLRLSVRPGRYLVRRHLASETRVKEIDLRPDAATTVREAELVAVSSGPLAAKSAAERDVSASIVPARAIELQAAGGVRHAPVIDPGLRLGEGGPGAVGILRASYGIGGGWQFMAPLAFGYGRGDRSGWDWVAWAGMPTLGLGRTDAAGTIVSGLAGAGFDLRRWLGAQTTFNASAAGLGAYSWTSRAPDATGAAPGRHAFDTWSAQLTGGFTRFVSDAVSLNLGVSINHNLVAAGDLAPWAGDDARGGLVLGIGSIQRRGLRPLPLVRVYLGDRLTLDGHVAVAYLPATKSVVETYLAGVTALF
jgi:hypothetical protein